MNSSAKPNNAYPNGNALAVDKNLSEGQGRQPIGWELSEVVGTYDVPACLRDIFFWGINDNPEMMAEAVKSLALFMKDRRISVDAATKILLLWTDATGNLSNLVPIKTEDIIRQTYGSIKDKWTCWEFKSKMSGKDAWIECDEASCSWIDKHRNENQNQIMAEEDYQVVEGEPSIKVINEDENVDTIGMSLEDGTIQWRKTVSKGKEQKQERIWISDCAAFIHTETRSSTDTEFLIKGRGARDGREHQLTITATNAVDKRKFNAAMLEAFGAENRIGTLTFETLQSISQNIIHQYKVTEPMWVNNKPMVPGAGFDRGVVFKLGQKIPAKVYPGDIHEANKCLRELCRVNKYAPIVIAAVLGAPAIARWQADNRFGIGIWGQTGTLKTTFSQAALSIYGEGYKEDTALLKFGPKGSTLVAAQEILLQAGILPQILDNVKTLGSRTEEIYVNTIHGVLEGTQKDRGKKEGGTRDVKEFKTTPIVTGEIRPEEASTTARMINLSWSKPTKEGREALSYVQTHTRLMPVLGYYWLRFLSETKLNLNVGFEEARNQKMDEFTAKGYVNPGRLATNYVILRKTWSLICESPLGEALKEYTEKFIEVLNEAIDEQGRIVSEETEAKKLINGVRELIASYPDTIQTGGEASSNGKISVIGKWIGENLFLLPEKTLTEINRIMSFTQRPTVDSMTRALHEEGYLIRGDTEHLKAKAKFNGTQVWGWLIPKEVIAGDANQTALGTKEGTTGTYREP